MIILETFIYPDELQQAVLAVRELCDLPVIAQMTIDEDATSLTGANPETTIRDLESFGADVVGVNCTVGPQIMLNWLEQVRKLTKMPISVMPNAGKPKNIDGRNIYLRLARVPGGIHKALRPERSKYYGRACCGTGPEHIKTMRNALNALMPQFNPKTIETVKLKEMSNVEPVLQEKKSRLARRLAEGHFVKFVELLAPHGVSAKNEIEKAREMYYSGVDVINIPDGPRASARMSALALAIQIQREVGIEAVLHFVCRDRNVIGIQ